MALFHLKELCSPAADDPIHWNYDRTELIADGIVHAFGVAFGLVGAIALFLVSPSSTVDTSVIVIYAVGLLTMLILSATYNLWPVSPRKWLLRRFDHSAIYLLIAATYTPFISQLNDASFATRFLIGVWGVAFAGTVLKLNFPGRFDKVSIALYLVLGWSGALAYDKAAASLPTLILALIVAGGGLYTMGVLFHSWQRLRFQNAIWHGFVMLVQPAISLPWPIWSRPEWFVPGNGCRRQAGGCVPARYFKPRARDNLTPCGGAADQHLALTRRELGERTVQDRARPAFRLV